MSAFKTLKLESRESAPYHTENNRFSIKISQYLKNVSLSDAVLQMNVRACNVADNSTPLDGSHQYGFRYKYGAPYLLVRNARLESSKQGILEEVHQANIMIKNLRPVYMDKGRRHAYSAIGGNADDDLEESSLVRKLKKGTTLSIQENEVQVYLKELFGFFQLPAADLDRLGDLYIHIELENDKNNILKDVFEIKRNVVSQSPYAIQAYDKTLTTAGGLNVIRFLTADPYAAAYPLQVGDPCFISFNLNGGSYKSILTQITDLDDTVGGGLTEVSFSEDLGADTNIITNARIFKVGDSNNKIVDGVDTTLAAPDLKSLNVLNANAAVLDTFANNGKYVVVKYVNGTEQQQLGKITNVGAAGSGGGGNAKIDFDMPNDFGVDTDNVTDIVITMFEFKLTRPFFGTSGVVQPNPAVVTAANNKTLSMYGSRYYVGERINVSYLYTTNKDNIDATMVCYDKVHVIAEISQNGNSQTLTLDSEYAPANRNMTYNPTAGNPGVIGGLKEIVIRPDDTYAGSVAHGNGANAPLLPASLTYNVQKANLVLKQLMNLSPMQKKALSSKYIYNVMMLERINQGVISADTTYNKQMDLPPNCSGVVLMPVYLSRQQ